MFFPANPVLFASSNDIGPLTSQVEQLSLDLHTEALLVEVERMKRWKLKASVKELKQNRINPNPVLSQVLLENNMMRERMVIIERDFNHEIARLISLTYQGFLRLH